MKAIVIALTLVMSAAASAEMYEWTDEKGVKHYTDRPVHKDAVKVDIEEEEEATLEELPAKEKAAKKEQKSYPCSNRQEIDRGQGGDRGPMRERCLEH